MSTINLDNETLTLLKESLTVFRVLQFPKAKQYLRTIFDDTLKISVFQNSDGKSTRDIAQITGLGKDTIAKLWNEWYELGLGTKVPAKGGGDRFVRGISLEMFGL